MLVRAGFSQVVAVDLSIEDIGIPVVKMIIPGLAEPTFENDAPNSPRIQNFLMQNASAARLLSSGLHTGGWS